MLVIISVLVIVEYMDLKNAKLPEILRDLRKESQYTQIELGLRLGISRETVSAVENGKRETIENLGLEVLGKWWSVCRTKARTNTREKFMEHIMGYFKFLSDKM